MVSLPKKKNFQKAAGFLIQLFRLKVGSALDILPAFSPLPLLLGTPPLPESWNMEEDYSPQRGAGTGLASVPLVHHGLGSPGPQSLSFLWNRGRRDCNYIALPPPTSELAPVWSGYIMSMGTPGETGDRASQG